VGSVVGNRKVERGVGGVLWSGGRIQEWGPLVRGESLDISPKGGIGPNARSRYRVVRGGMGRFALEVRSRDIDPSP